MLSSNKSASYLNNKSRLLFLNFNVLDDTNYIIHIHSDDFLSRQRSYSVLKNITTGDKRLVFHSNIQWKRDRIYKDNCLQPTPKA